MNQKIKIERRIHDIWKGQRQVQKIIKMEIPFGRIGKYHYFYSSKKGIISLIKVVGITTSWEICGGGLVEMQRFPTKIKADRFIRRILS